MDFGKVENLDNIDFALPPDRIQTIQLFDEWGNKPAKKTESWVGCAKWGRKDWIGQVYPPGTREKDFFSIYARNFNAIELNATHYRIPTAKTVADWKSKVSTDFMFCPKFPQIISHYRRLKHADDTTASFYEAIQLLGNNLGPSFLQLPPNFGPKSHVDLENYIISLPAGWDVCVEFRHAGWFEDTLVCRNIFAMMKEKNIGTVITDAAGRRDCVHQLLTTRQAFIRFVGNSLHPTDYSRVDDWVQRIKDWLDKGLEKVYFFMHQHEERYSPILCDYFITQLNQVAITRLKRPQLYNEPKDNVVPGLL